MTAPNEALRTILPIAGLGDTQAADVMFTGGVDPVLPTPFRIGAAGAALALQTVAHGNARWFALNRKVKLPAAAGGVSGHG